MRGAIGRWWRRVTARPGPGEASTPEATAPDASGAVGAPGALTGHAPGRAHLVLEDGNVVEADLDAADSARLEYLARRVAPPPPPER